MAIEPTAHAFAQNVETRANTAFQVYRAGEGVKRIFDIVVASTLVFIFLPLLLLVAILIVITSGRPVLFRQKRGGRNGVPFMMLKFRTMRPGTAGENRQTSRGDDRVTPIGRILRRSSLDELPQLFNVIIGDMSLVGPRPHPDWLDQQSVATMPEYVARLRMRPGITGLAQVRGLRGAMSTHDDLIRRVEADLEYLNTWSFSLDLYILALTPSCLLMDENAF
jgi:putative colanic acid biosynthesis UDP-glucose lipid carrier transferase